MNLSIFPQSLMQKNNNLKNNKLRNNNLKDYTQTNNTQINFKSTNNFYKKFLTNVPDKYTRKTISNYTCMFRKDLDWKNFTNFLDNHFKDKKQVNLYSVASSDGSEPYTMVMSLLKHATNPQKFLPIKASDQCINVVNFSKKGMINLCDEDFFKINNHAGKFTDYFEKSKIEKKISDNDKLKSTTYVAKPILTKNVNFSVSTIDDTLNKLDDKGNTVILCRNVFPYFNSENLKKTLDLLGTKMKPGSILAIGNYDNIINIAQRLYTRGFKCVEHKKNILENVFQYVGKTE